MSTPIDVELILRIIDEAGRDWQDKFKNTTDGLIQAVGEFCYDSTRALAQLSISTGDNERVKQDGIAAEHIASKLKELRDALGDLWPVNINSFGRDIFDVDPYHVEAAEFFHPVSFYPGVDLLMKLYRWSVYDSNNSQVDHYDHRKRPQNSCIR